MNALSLAALGAALLLTITDPTGDAAGDGTLTPPTSPIYANSAIFDLQEVHLEQAAESAASESQEALLSITLGAVDLDETFAAGFAGVVIDVYLDFAPGGSGATLAGPGMLLPTGSGWDYAVRVSPAGAFGVAYQEPEGPEEPNADAGTEPQEPAADDAADGAGTALNLEPLTSWIDGNRLVVSLPFSLAEDDVQLYALTGVYDPFSTSSWRPLADSPSPWAYSGGEQLVPVIDVLAGDQEAQTRALRSGVLPRSPRSVPIGVPWLVLMGLGVALALAGLWFRRRVPTPERQGLPYGLPPEPEATEEAEETEEAEGSAEKKRKAAGATAVALPDTPHPASPELDTAAAAARPDSPHPASPELDVTTAVDQVDDDGPEADAFERFGSFEDDEDDEGEDAEVDGFRPPRDLSQ